MPARHRWTAALAILTAVSCGFVGAALIGAGSARAHAALIASDPAGDGELAQPPVRVSATFNEPMQAQFAAMAVIGPDRQQWSDGDPTVDGAQIGVGLRPGAPAGVYTVNYRATSADGHVVSGSWSYRVTAAPPATSPPPGSPTSTVANAAPPSTPTTTDDDPPVWPFVAAATAIVAAAALWAVRRS
ncbi:copper resistance protein CopC [Mycobacterium sp. Y57]|uniref:copper resistance CopC family protein n=1 Tax=Mycolicibacterium xanthum TaxID=2796469 RepID=UPI001C8462B6|nr:copper resistance CopC family protein [Mycolicibacterium xanthum]MBX7430986.1 copper resistance protein CopC [Mycolicibacterium xanthum]